MITTDQLQIIKKPIHDVPSTMQEDYSVLLAKYTETFRQDDHYLYVGAPGKTQGWLLHITVIPFQMERMMDAILPSILFYHVPFKIIKNKALHEEINAANHGMYKVGKVFTLFLDNDTIIEQLTKELIEKTSDFQGPQVTTDFTISNNLFARYGTFIPQIQVDAFGNHMRVLKDRLGNFYEDKYHLPPTIPLGVSNPFMNVAVKAPPEEKHFIIAGKYLVTSKIKSDVKGNVYKGLYFNKYQLPKWCIIKEGRKGIFPDKQGRDVRSRLDWQEDINKVFNAIIPTPKVLGNIHEKDVSYLVTEYIPAAKNLNHYLVKKVLHKPWFSQPDHLQLEILNYLSQILTIIQTIHNSGYIHRDITDNNFMVTKNKKVHAIDLELVYSIKDNKPNPPFGVGTPGYMSPEQENQQDPIVQDDTYSLGAVMVMLFSGGIEPAYLVDRNQPGLYERMLFLTQNEKLSSLVTSCMDMDPLKRPSVKQIIQYIDFIKEKVGEESIDKVEYVGSFAMEQVLKQGINTLASDLMAHNGLWYSKVENEYGWDAYPLGDKHFYSNIHQGIGGIIYFLTLLKKAGYDISAAEDKMNIGIQFILTDITERLSTMAPSLYYGKAGLAVMISKLLSTGMMKTDPGYISLIEELLRTPSITYDIIYGIAGQGLAALQCMDTLDPQFSSDLLHHYAEILIQRQRLDGAWNKDDEAEKKEIVTGLGYGVAGIVYFLLKFGSKYHNNTALASAEKGLKYLVNQLKKKNDHYEWPASNLTKDAGNWWCVGGPGMALAFLKFYELTKSEFHLKVAEKALRKHPNNFVYYKLSQCHGLAGLGEIYLEAYRVTQKSEWIERATWIANQLFHFRKQPTSGDVYWLTEKHVLPTANFMTGDSGVLHFLTRYNNQEKFTFPIMG
jgi:serine/threonine protein kinase